jgi:hypothetical protein
MRLFPCLVLLCACSHPTQWEQSRVHGASSEYDSSRLVYHSQNRMTGIDLEWIKLENDSFFYLNVHGPAIQQSHIVLIIDNEREVFEGLSHAGGHRVAIPDAYKDKILNAILAEKPITLQIDGYIEKIGQYHNNNKKKGLL